VARLFIESSSCDVFSLTHEGSVKSTRFVRLRRGGGRGWVNRSANIIFYIACFLDTKAMASQQQKKACSNVTKVCHLKVADCIAFLLLYGPGDGNET
jgi:hypothetical protein